MWNCLGNQCGDAVMLMAMGLTTTTSAAPENQTCHCLSESSLTQVANQFVYNSDLNLVFVGH